MCCDIYVGCDFLNTGRFIKVALPKLPRALSATAPAATGEMAGEARHSASDLLGCRTVFLKNLPYDVTEQEITASLQVCGPISSVRLAAWNHTGAQKGEGKQVKGNLATST
jgi:hypothetical protein